MGSAVATLRTNTDFGRFLYDLKPQSSQAKLAFYNYIRNDCDLQEAFAPEVVFGFYLKALQCEHWQKNILELSQEVQHLLEKFLGKEISAPAWKKLKTLDQIQIIKIKNPQDYLEAIKNFVSSGRKKSQFQIFADRGSLAHAVILNPDASIQVQTFDDHFYLQSGQLYPLCQDRILYYNKKLELLSNVRQQIQVSPHISARFVIRDDMVVGDFVRGFTFQSYRKIELHGLHQDSQIHYAIKRIERFFIDRTSEPLYVDLIQVLEQTIDFLKKDLPGSAELARKAYMRGKNSLENIFIDDKMLAVLLKEILATLNTKGISKWNLETSSESTNSYPKLELALEELQID